VHFGIARTCLAYESLQLVQKNLMRTSFAREIMPSIQKIEQEIFIVEQQGQSTTAVSNQGLVILTFPLRYYFQGK
jgi:hypothetical protein